MSRSGSWAVLLVAFAVGAALCLYALRDAAPPDLSLDATVEGDGAPRDPFLAGAGVVEKGAYAEVTDLRTLLQATWGNNEAEDRLVEILEVDAAAVARLVDWLHPDHDPHRRPPLPAGLQRSFSGNPDLDALCHLFQRLGTGGVVALASALENESAGLRLRAAACLGNLGPAGAAAVPALLARLEGEREDGYGQAAMLQALSAMGPAAKEALSAFHAFLRDEHRADAARAAAAGGFLAIAGPTEEALTTCALALHDQSYDVCMALLPEIALLEEAGAPLVPDLLDLLHDEYAHGGVVQQCLYVLGEIATADPPTIAALVQIARDVRREDGLRTMAVRALAKWGPEAIDDLLAAIAASDDESRLLLVGALAPAALEGHVEVPRLLALLDSLRASEWESERASAVHTAVSLRPPASIFVPWLRPFQKDVDPEVRRSVLYALTDLPDPSGEVAPLLADGIEDADPSVRRRALYVLNERCDSLPDDAAHLRTKRIVDGVLAILGGPDEYSHGVAAEALDRVAPEHNDAAIHVWIQAFEHHWHPTRAAEVLERLGPRAAEAVPALECALKNWSDVESVRRKIEAALAAIRGP